MGNDKQCTKCFTIKSIEDFPRNFKGDDLNRFSWCKACKSDYRKLPHRKAATNARKTAKRKSKYVEQRKIERQRWYKRQYGITLEQYEEMLKKQDHKCAICEISETANNRSLHVDHCHKTGKVRDLLCSHCNTVLGKVKESLEQLDRLKDYITRHRSDG